MVLIILALCWVFYFVTKLIFDLAVSGDAWGFLAGRLLVIAVGSGLSFCMYLVLRAFWGKSIALISLLVVVCASVAAVPFALFNWWMLATFASTSQPMLVHAMVAWSASVHLFFAQAVAIVAFLYATQLRDREAEAVHAEQHLRRAELRALRYQVNPHFLFNAFNSVSALLSANRSAEADRMVSRLADYYESALTADHQELVPLSAEIDTQFQYLEIERIRFPERLSVRVELEDKLRDALVPTLMLQPLVENSIKHAVAASSEQVEIRILVREEEERLVIVVADSCPTVVRRSRKGAGVGLANIRARLRHFYGKQASLTAEAVDDGFYNRIILPLKFR